MVQTHKKSTTNHSENHTVVTGTITTLQRTCDKINTTMAGYAQFPGKMGDLNGQNIL